MPFMIDAQLAMPAAGSNDNGCAVDLASRGQVRRECWFVNLSYDPLAGIRKLNNFLRRLACGAWSAIWPKQDRLRLGADNDLRGEDSEGGEKKTQHRSNLLVDGPAT